MVQRLEEQSFNSCAELGKEILSLLRLRQGQIKVSLLRSGAVLVEKESAEERNST
jgi:hypothetical protein